MAEISDRCIFATAKLIIDKHRIDAAFVWRRIKTAMAEGGSRDREAASDRAGGRDKALALGPAGLQSHAAAARCDFRKKRQKGPRPHKSP